MVSANCSSMRWPWTEISGGMGHMCITMGTAEAIAITTMVTAKSFAIFPPLPVESGELSNRRRASCGDSLIYATYSEEKIRDLFAFKGEIRRSGPTGGNRYL